MTSAATADDRQRVFGTVGEAAGSTAARIDLKAFLETDFAGRIHLANQARGARLWSPELAQVWTDFLQRLATADLANDAAARQVIRELIALAPESEAASNGYRSWIGDDRRVLMTSGPAIVHLVVSCEKYKSKAVTHHEAIARHLQPCYILLGNPSLKEAAFDGHFLIVPAPDNYEGLPQKIMEGLVAVRRRFGAVGLLKIDDDLEFVSPPQRHRIAELVAHTQYAGRVIGAADFDRCWHVGKCEHHPDEPYRRRFRGAWAGGPLYYLGPKAVDALVREYLFFRGEFDGEIFEDKVVGDVLRSHGILPVSADLPGIFGMTFAIDMPPTKDARGIAPHGDAGDSPSCLAVEMPSSMRTGEVPILAYHSVADDGPPELAAYRVSPTTLAAQMRYLRQRGYYSISLEEWAQSIAEGRVVAGRPIVITFDDGYKNFLTHAAPVLEACDFRATVFVVAGKVGGTADWDITTGAALELMDWDDLRSLERKGFAIGSHTMSHVNLCTLTDEEIVRDSIEARAVLSAQLGHEVDSIAFPGGHSDSRVRTALLRGGYKIAVGIVGGRSALGDDVINLPRIEIFGDDDLDAFIHRVEMNRHREIYDQKRQSSRMPPRGGARMPHTTFPKKTSEMTTTYMRLLADRVGSVIDSMLALQTDLLTAASPPESTQQRIAGMFSMAVSNEGGCAVMPYEPIAPGICLGFEQTATVRLTVRPKRFQALSPDTCPNTLELSYSGVSRWLTLEVETSWSELADGQRYQLNISAEPDDAINCRAALRMPQREGATLDHDLAGFFLSPGRRSSAISGEVKLPNLDSADTSRKPILLLFLEPRQDLKLTIHYLNIYLTSSNDIV